MAFFDVYLNDDRSVIVESWPPLETAAFGLVFPPDGTTNHSTKLAKTASKVAGYTRG